MDWVQAAVLGTLQGFTEILPVSSSAHLVLLPWTLGWKYQGLAYDVALHWGTLLALGIHFGGQWWGILRAGLRRDGTAESRLFWGIAAGTIPAVVVGLALEHRVEALFHEPRRMAATLMIFGLILGLADRHGKRSKGLDALGLRECLLIGMAQALALVPGVSRSGVTITAGLFLGVRREDAARFSFLLAVPVVLGAGILKIPDVGGAISTGSFWIGIEASTAAGYAAIRFMLGYVRSRDMRVFVIYRLALGTLLLFQ
ncbi:MAG: undecaprenyl-diphosphate phosphatase [Elusimicrobia bacterium]|nr:undecaprenyl-diphosphate phosphatase [Elusimicrobiota bacterium]